MRACWLLALAVAACGSESSHPPPHRDPPRRVIEPPRTDVRALPPHEITATGIGPYKLATPLAQIVSALPSGPRIAIMQIPAVVDHSLVRDGGLIIGGERQGDASFVAVITPTIARTSAGVGVGSPLSLAQRGLGPPAADPRWARDPRLWVGSALPNARFVLFGDRIGAVIVTAALSEPDPAAAAPPCARHDVPADLAVPRATRGACLDGADAIAVVDDSVVAMAIGDGKVRRIAAIDLPGLRWAAPIDAGGRDDVVAVVERTDSDERTIAVVSLGLEGGRLVKLGEIDAYRLTETNAAWIGARLADLDARLEIRRSGEDLLIGGILVHGDASAVRDVAPLLPVTLRLHRRTAEDRDRGRTDAGTVPDAGIDAPAP